MQKFLFKLNDFIVNITSQVSKFVNIFTGSLSQFIPNSGEVKTRIYSGIIYGAIFVFAMFKGGMLFNILMLIIAIIIYQEWNDIIAPLKTQSFKKYQLWFLGGILYTIVPIAAVISIRSLEHGKMIAFWYFAVIWTNDCGAYFIGRKIQGTKLAPNISPSKTFSGLLGGIILSGIVGGVLKKYLILPIPFGIIECMSTAIIVAFTAQMSDLLESIIKRKFNVKDSGNIIPGHGGIMDRMDSLTLSAPLFFILINAGNKIFF